MDTGNELNDRGLVGITARREITRQSNITTFAKESGVSRKTLERVFAGDTVGRGTLDRIEGALGLPRDTFAAIEVHDMDSLVEIGVEPDLVRWVRQELVKSALSDAITG